MHSDSYNTMEEHTKFLNAFSRFGFPFIAILYIKLMLMLTK